jgi:hypothetical protein
LHHTATVRIKIICTYAPDDELDKNGNNPTLHFQRDAARNFYNALVRNIFCMMQTMVCHAGFFLDVGMMTLMASVLVMDVCMLMSLMLGWPDTKEYCLISQFQLPFLKTLLHVYSAGAKILLVSWCLGTKQSETLYHGCARTNCKSF